MEKEIVEVIINERVNKNQKLFTENELQFIKKHSILVEKIYILGMLDSNIVRN